MIIGANSRILRCRLVLLWQAHLKGARKLGCVIPETVFSCRESSTTSRKATTFIRANNSNLCLRLDSRQPKEENKNKRMLRQVQHETRRTLQPELIEGVEAVFFN
jgi:hypothetical protein